MDGRIEASTPGMLHGEGPVAPTRPVALPRCEHGGRPGWCIECQKRDTDITARVKFLADEFWEHRGERDIEHLLLRAYRMGMKHAKEQTGPMENANSFDFSEEAAVVNGESVVWRNEQTGQTIVLPRGVEPVAPGWVKDPVRANL